MALDPACVRALLLFLDERLAPDEYGKRAKGVKLRAAVDLPPLSAYPREDVFAAAEFIVGEKLASVSVKNAAALPPFVWLYYTFLMCVLSIRGVFMFYETLKCLCEKRGIRVTSLVSELGISSGNLSKWKNGGVPRGSTLAKLSDYFGVTTDYLLGRDAAQDGPPASTGGVWVPVLGRVAAGVPVEAVTDVIDYEEITLDMASQGEHFGLRVRGDSMAPIIMDGDVVIVRRQDDADSGDTVVAMVNSEDATVKRLKKSAEGLMLLPANPAYDPLFFTNDQVSDIPVHIIGKVVELRRTF